MFRATFLLSCTLVACGLPYTGAIKSKGDVQKVIAKTQTISPSNNGPARDGIYMTMACPAGGELSVTGSYTQQPDGKFVAQGVSDYDACAFTEDLVIGGHVESTTAVDLAHTSGAVGTYEGTIEVTDHAAQTFDRLIYKPLTMSMTWSAQGTVYSYTVTLTGTVNANGTDYTYDGESYSDSFDTAVL